jgi:alkylation response protein AidB-like acyl-CoA dehydrogenase
MGAEGLLGLPIPARYGGAGMDYIAFALLCEEMERADTAFRVILSVQKPEGAAHFGPHLDARAVADEMAEFFTAHLSSS